MYEPYFLKVYIYGVSLETKCIASDTISENKWSFDSLEVWVDG